MINPGRGEKLAEHAPAVSDDVDRAVQAAVAAGLGNGNVPEIFDYFLKLEA